MDIEAAEAANNRSKAAQLKKDKFAELVKKLRAKTKTARKTLVGGWLLRAGLSCTAGASDASCCMWCHQCYPMQPSQMLLQHHYSMQPCSRPRPVHPSTRHMSLTLLPACSFLPPGKLSPKEVTDADMARVISRWTGIPLTKLVESERDKLLHLGQELHKWVVVRGAGAGAVHVCTYLRMAVCAVACGAGATAACKLLCYGVVVGANVSFMQPRLRAEGH